MKTVVSDRTVLLRRRTNGIGTYRSKQDVLQLPFALNGTACLRHLVAWHLTVFSSFYRLQLFTPESSVNVSRARGHGWA